MAHKILLIDDDVDLIELNKSVLLKNGYQVDFAFNGTDGIEKAKSNHPDLIVLDVMMTEVGEGFEVARTIRTIDEIKNTPILMLSSVNQEHDFNLTISADDDWNPVDWFVEKPISPKDLLKKIENILKTA